MDAGLWTRSPTREVVDPGFPRGGRQPLSLSENLLFGKVFARNCMKMKEIGPRGGIYTVQQNSCTIFADLRNSLFNLKKQRELLMFLLSKVSCTLKPSVDHLWWKQFEPGTCHLLKAQLPIIHQEIEWCLWTANPCTPDCSMGNPHGLSSLNLEALYLRQV